MPGFLVDVNVWVALHFKNHRHLPGIRCATVHQSSRLQRSVGRPARLVRKAGRDAHAPVKMRPFRFVQKDRLWALPRSVPISRRYVAVL